MEIVPPYMTVPPYCELKPSSVEFNKIGIWAKHFIKADSRFGPYEGVKKKLTEKSDSYYSWEIKGPSGRRLFCIDASDPRTSNWLRYIRGARYYEEQNMVAVQHNKQIFYKTIKDISPNEELLCWYNIPVEYTEYEEVDKIESSTVEKTTSHIGSKPTTDLPRKRGRPPSRKRNRNNKALNTTDKTDNSPEKDCPRKRGRTYTHEKYTLNNMRECVNKETQLDQMSTVWRDADLKQPLKEQFAETCQDVINTESSISKKLTGQSSFTDKVGKNISVPCNGTSDKVNDLPRKAGLKILAETNSDSNTGTNDSKPDNHKGCNAMELPNADTQGTLDKPNKDSLEYNSEIVLEREDTNKVVGQVGILQPVTCEVERLETTNINSNLDVFNTPTKGKKQATEQNEKVLQEEQEKTKDETVSVAYNADDSLTEANTNKDSPAYNSGKLLEREDTDKVIGQVGILQPVTCEVERLETTNINSNLDVFNTPINGEKQATEQTEKVLQEEQENIKDGTTSNAYNADYSLTEANTNKDSLENNSGIVLERGDTDKVIGQEGILQPVTCGVERLETTNINSNLDVFNTPINGKKQATEQNEIVSQEEQEKTKDETMNFATDTKTINDSPEYNSGIVLEREDTDSVTGQVGIPQPVTCEVERLETTNINSNLDVFNTPTNGKKQATEKKEKVLQEEQEKIKNGAVNVAYNADDSITKAKTNKDSSEYNSGIVLEREDTDKVIGQVRILQPVTCEVECMETTNINSDVDVFKTPINEKKQATEEMVLQEEQEKIKNGSMNVATETKTNKNSSEYNSGIVLEREDTYKDIGHVGILQPVPCEVERMESTNINSNLDVFNTPINGKKQATEQNEIVLQEEQEKTKDETMNFATDTKTINDSPEYNSGIVLEREDTDSVTGQVGIPQPVTCEVERLETTNINSNLDVFNTPTNGKKQATEKKEKVLQEEQEKIKNGAVNVAYNADESITKAKTNKDSSEYNSGIVLEREDTDKVIGQVRILQPVTCEVECMETTNINSDVDVFKTPINEKKQATEEMVLQEEQEKIKNESMNVATETKTNKNSSEYNSEIVLEKEDTYKDIGHVGILQPVPCEVERMESTNINSNLDVFNTPTNGKKQATEKKEKVLQEEQEKIKNGAVNVAYNADDSITKAKTNKDSSEYNSGIVLEREDTDKVIGQVRILQPVTCEVECMETTNINSDVDVFKTPINEKKQATEEMVLQEEQEKIKNGSMNVATETKTNKNSSEYNSGIVLEREDTYKDIGHVGILQPVPCEVERMESTNINSNLDVFETLTNGKKLTTEEKVLQEEQEKIKYGTVNVAYNADDSITEANTNKDGPEYNSGIVLKREDTDRVTGLVGILQPVTSEVEHTETKNINSNCDVFKIPQNGKKQATEKKEKVLQEEQEKTKGGTVNVPYNKNDCLIEAKKNKDSPEYNSGIVPERDDTDKVIGQVGILQPVTCEPMQTLNVKRSIEDAKGWQETPQNRKKQIVWQKQISSDKVQMTKNGIPSLAYNANGCMGAGKTDKSVQVRDDFTKAGASHTEQEVNTKEHLNHLDEMDIMNSKNAVCVGDDTIVKQVISNAYKDNKLSNNPQGCDSTVKETALSAIVVKECPMDKTLGEKDIVERISTIVQGELKQYCSGRSTTKVTVREPQLAIGKYELNKEVTSVGKMDLDYEKTAVNKTMHVPKRISTGVGNDGEFNKVVKENQQRTNDSSAIDKQENQKTVMETKMKPTNDDDCTSEKNHSVVCSDKHIISNDQSVHQQKNECDSPHHISITSIEGRLKMSIKPSDYTIGERIVNVQPPPLLKADSQNQTHNVVSTCMKEGTADKGEHESNHTFRRVVEQYIQQADSQSADEIVHSEGRKLGSSPPDITEQLTLEYEPLDKRICKEMEAIDGKCEYESSRPYLLELSAGMIMGGKSNNTEAPYARDEEEIQTTEETADNDGGKYESEKAINVSENTILEEAPEPKQNVVETREDPDQKLNDSNGVFDKGFVSMEVKLLEENIEHVESTEEISSDILYKTEGDVIDLLQPMILEVGNLLAKPTNDNIDTSQVRTNQKTNPECETEVSTFNWSKLEGSTSGERTKEKVSKRLKMSEDSHHRLEDSVIDWSEKIKIKTSHQNAPDEATHCTFQIDASDEKKEELPEEQNISEDGQPKLNYSVIDLSTVKPNGEYAQKVKAQTVSAENQIPGELLECNVHKLPKCMFESKILVNSSDASIMESVTAKEIGKDLLICTILPDNSDPSNSEGKTVKPSKMIAEAKNVSDKSVADNCSMDIEASVDMKDEQKSDITSDITLRDFTEHASSVIVQINDGSNNNLVNSILQGENINESKRRTVEHIQNKDELSEICHHTMYVSAVDQLEPTTVTTDNENILNDTVEVDGSNKREEDTKNKNQLMKDVGENALEETQSTTEVEEIVDEPSGDYKLQLTKYTPDTSKEVQVNDETINKPVNNGKREAEDNKNLLQIKAVEDISIGLSESEDNCKMEVGSCNEKIEELITASYEGNSKELSNCASSSEVVHMKESVLDNDSFGSMDIETVEKIKQYGVIDLSVNSSATLNDTMKIETSAKTRNEMKFDETLLDIQEKLAKYICEATNNRQEEQITDNSLVHSVNRKIEENTENLNVNTNHAQILALCKTESSQTALQVNGSDNTLHNDKYKIGEMSEHGQYKMEDCVVDLSTVPDASVNIIKTTFCSMEVKTSTEQPEDGQLIKRDTVMLPIVVKEDGELLNNSSNDSILGNPPQVVTDKLHNYVDNGNDGYNIQNVKNNTECLSNEAAFDNMEGQILTTDKEVNSGQEQFESFVINLSKRVDTEDDNKLVVAPIDNIDVATPGRGELKHNTEKMAECGLEDTVINLSKWRCMEVSDGKISDKATPTIKNVAFIEAETEEQLLETVKLVADDKQVLRDSMLDPSKRSIDGTEIVINFSKQKSKLHALGVTKESNTGYSGLSNMTTENDSGEVQSSKKKTEVEQVDHGVKSLIHTSEAHVQISEDKAGNEAVKSDDTEAIGENCMENTSDNIKKMYNAEHPDETFHQTKTSRSHSSEQNVFSGEDAEATSEDSSGRTCQATVDIKSKDQQKSIVNEDVGLDANGIERVKVWNRSTTNSEKQALYFDSEDMYGGHSVSSDDITTLTESLRLLKTNGCSDMSGSTIPQPCKDDNIYGFNRKNKVKLTSFSKGTILEEIEKSTSELNISMSAAKNFIDDKISLDKETDLLAVGQNEIENDDNQSISDTDTTTYEYMQGDLSEGDASQHDEIMSKNTFVTSTFLFVDDFREETKKKEVDGLDIGMAKNHTEQHISDLAPRYQDDNLSLTERNVCTSELKERLYTLDSAKSKYGFNTNREGGTCMVKQTKTDFQMDCDCESSTEHGLPNETVISKDNVDTVHEISKYDFEQTGDPGINILENRCLGNADSTDGQMIKSKENSTVKQAEIDAFALPNSNCSGDGYIVGRKENHCNAIKEATTERADTQMKTSKYNTNEIVIFKKGSFRKHNFPKAYLPIQRDEAGKPIIFSSFKQFAIDETFLRQQVRGKRRKAYLKCQLCPCAVEHRASLKRHYFVHHVEDKFKNLSGKSRKMKIAEQNEKVCNRDIGSRRQIHNRTLPNTTCNSINVQENELPNSRKLRSAVYHEKQNKKDSAMLFNEEDVDDEVGDHKPLYPCKICGQLLKSHKYLVEHMSSHTNQEIINCPECPRQFLCKAALDRHFLMHSGDKLYSCTYCDNKFSTLDGWRKHEKLHSGFRPHKCDKCKITFIHETDLQRHMNMKHTDNDGSEEVKSPCTNPNATVDQNDHSKSPKNHKCTMCQRIFRKSSGLRRHMNLVHKYFRLKPMKFADYSQDVTDISSDSSLDGFIEADNFKDAVSDSLCQYLDGKIISEKQKTVTPVLHSSKEAIPKIRISIKDNIYEQHIVNENTIPEKISQEKNHTCSGTADKPGSQPPLNNSGNEKKLDPILNLIVTTPDIQLDSSGTKSRTETFPTKTTETDSPLVIVIDDTSGDTCENLAIKPASQLSEINKPISNTTQTKHSNLIKSVDVKIKTPPSAATRPPFLGSSGPRDFNPSVMKRKTKQIDQSLTETVSSKESPATCTGKKCPSSSNILSEVRDLTPASSKAQLRLPSKLMSVEMRKATRHSSTSSKTMTTHKQHEFINVPQSKEQFNQPTTQFTISQDSVIPRTSCLQPSTTHLQYPVPTIPIIQQYVPIQNARPSHPSTHNNIGSMSHLVASVPTLQQPTRNVNNQVVGPQQTQRYIGNSPQPVTCKSTESYVVSSNSTVQLCTGSTQRANISGGTIQKHTSLPSLVSSNPALRHAIMTCPSMEQRPVYQRYMHVAPNATLGHQILTGNTPVSTAQHENVYTGNRQSDVQQNSQLLNLVNAQSPAITPILQHYVYSGNSQVNPRLSTPHFQQVATSIPKATRNIHKSNVLVTHSAQKNVVPHHFVQSTPGLLKQNVQQSFVSIAPAQSMKSTPCLVWTSAYNNFQSASTSSQGINLDTAKQTILMSDAPFSKRNFCKRQRVSAPVKQYFPTSTAKTIPQLLNMNPATVQTSNIAKTVPPPLFFVAPNTATVKPNTLQVPVSQLTSNPSTPNMQSILKPAERNVAHTMAQQTATTKTIYTLGGQAIPTACYAINNVNALSTLSTPVKRKTTEKDNCCDLPVKIPNLNCQSSLTKMKHVSRKQQPHSAIVVDLTTDSSEGNCAKPQTAPCQQNIPFSDSCLDLSMSGLNKPPNLMQGLATKNVNQRGGTVTNDNVRTAKSDTLFACNVCRQAFYSVEALREHVVLHGNEWKFKCENCAQLFKCTIDLAAHRYEKHRAKTYMCTKCQKPISSLAKLKQHEIKYHFSAHTVLGPGTINIQESAINEMVSQTRAPVYGMDMESGTVIEKTTCVHDSKTNSCTHCGVEFTDTKDCETHALLCAARHDKMRSTQIQERASSGNELNIQESIEKNDLTVAEHLTTKSVDFRGSTECQRCGRGFTNWENLQKHNKMCPNRDKMRIANWTRDLTKMMSTYDKNGQQLIQHHKCPHCQRKFTYIQSLKKHIEICINKTADAQQRPTALNESSSDINIQNRNSTEEQMTSRATNERIMTTQLLEDRPMRTKEGGTRKRRAGVQKQSLTMQRQDQLISNRVDCIDELDVTRIEQMAHMIHEKALNQAMEKKRKKEEKERIEAILIAKNQQSESLETVPQKRYRVSSPKHNSLKIYRDDRQTGVLQSDYEKVGGMPHMNGSSKPHKPNPVKTYPIRSKSMNVSRKSGLSVFDYVSDY